MCILDGVSLGLLCGKCVGLGVLLGLFGGLGVSVGILPGLLSRLGIGIGILTRLLGERRSFLCLICRSRCLLQLGVGAFAAGFDLLKLAHRVAFEPLGLDRILLCIHRRLLGEFDAAV